MKFQVVEVDLPSLNKPQKVGERRYPFNTLEVGQGMVIPPNVPRSSVSSCASTWGKKHGRKFSMCLIDGQHILVRTA